MDRAFKSLDKNGDGFISKVDIMKLLKKQMPKEQAREKVKSIFLNVDTEKTGQIQYSKFIAAVTN